ncbi:MAG TPA: sulfur carrier protein ThiS [Alphaproteobacteria bacterium]|nr:sulfur carrier protein ThiS [Micavibrio sp.]MBK9563493.1 sulfur carrier protein ThiS [Micavibrio sp.]HQX27839.1 sulfur carrier protein ThiS [Alphaproteobacteria bacterium]
MIITINGQRKSVNCAPDINSVLDAEGFNGKLVAVARNGEFVPRVTYANTELQDGDALEIVAPYQGG